MAPLNKEQFAQIRDERREKIVEAGKKVFARNGIAGTKISMIAAEAGMSHGLLYHYFKSKEDLLHHIIQNAIAEASAFQQEVIAMDGTPLEKIRHVTSIVLGEDENTDILVFNQVLRADDIPEPTMELVRELSASYPAFFLPLIIEGQRLGEIVPGDPEELLSVFLHVVSGLISLDVHWGTGNLESKVEILLRMIAAR